MTGKLTYPDQRSKRYVLVPFCLLCQGFQARGLVRFGHSSVIKPILDALTRHDVNIVQMPCPESQLGGFEKGLAREPKGIGTYDTEEFRHLCAVLADNTAKMIRGIIANDFSVELVLGVEFSPSCSIRLQYSNKGTTHRPGLFIEALSNRLQESGIVLPMIGINRRNPRSTVEEINRTLGGGLL